MEPQDDSTIRSYLKGVERQLKLLKSCLKKIHDGKERSLQEIRQTILRYKNQEIRDVLKINDLQLNLLFSLQHLIRIGSMQWPTDFDYKKFYWRGYHDCGNDVSNILGLEKRKILREVEIQTKKKQERKEKRRKRYEEKKQNE
jgi:hypothetical protein